MNYQVVKRGRSLFFILGFLFATSVLLFSTVSAQQMTPGAITLYESEEGVINLTVNDVADIEDLSAVSFQVAPLSTGFSLTIDPGDLFSGLDQGQDYLFLKNQNVPAAGFTTVAIAFIGDEPPRLNRNGSSLARFTLTAPDTPNPIVAALAITSLTLLDQNGRTLGTSPSAINTNITVAPINGVTVLGTVNLEQVPSPNIPEVSQPVQLYTESEQPVPIAGAFGVPDANGDFTIIGGTGPVRVYLPPLQGLRPIPDGFLPVMTQLTILDGPPQELREVVRLAGDVVTDGETSGCPAINMQDIVAIASRVGGPLGSNRLYDLNQNQAIDASDLLMAARNFGTTGYVDWQTNELNQAVCPNL